MAYEASAPSVKCLTADSASVASFITLSLSVSMALVVVISLVLSLVLVHITTKVVYNLYFHPLSRIPGPSLWCALRLPSLWAMLHGKLPNRVKFYHEKYGPVVRIAPDELSFDDAAAWNDIYLSQALDYPPQWASTKMVGVGVANVIGTSSDIHSRLRERIDSAVSEGSAGGFEPIVTQTVDQLIEQMRALARKKTDKQATLDIVKWLNLGFVDIMAEGIWGGKSGFLESARSDILLDITRLLKQKLVATIVACYPTIGFFLSPLVFILSPRPRVLHKYCRGKVMECLSRPRMTNSPKPVQPDLFDSILHGSGAESVSVNEMEQASLDLVMTGSRMVTAVLIGTLNYLLRDLSKYDHLVQEIRGSFQTEAEITGSTTRSLSYLHAVITEGLRIAPPMPDGLRRRVPTDNVKVAGCSLPVNTMVSTGCWVQFMNPRNFACPSEFVPERWLHAKGSGGAGGRTIVDTANLAAFYPFGLGACECAGEALVWLELRVTLAKLLWNFDFSLPPDKMPPAWNEQDVFWFWDMQPMEVLLRPRRRF